jgi:hypothetical protein
VKTSLVLILGLILPAFGMAAEYGVAINRDIPWNEVSCYRIGTEVEYARVVRDSDGRKELYFEKFVVKVITDGEVVREVSDAWDKGWGGADFIDDCLERLVEHAKRREGA